MVCLTLDQWLPLILNWSSPTGDLIISDDSNSRGGNFKRMTRPSGLVKWGWRFAALAGQPLLKGHSLSVVTATRDVPLAGSDEATGQ